MITPAHRKVVDDLWAAFEDVGIEDGYDIVEQVTFLLFVRRFDVIQTAAERKARISGADVEAPIFGHDQQELRWSALKNLDGETMFKTVTAQVVPFVQHMGGPMRDVRLTIPTAASLSRIVDLLDQVPFADPATNGGIYEYLLSKISTKNSSGGFPTPRHVIQLMIEMIAPGPTDVLCDPASGTGGFLVAATNRLRAEHSGMLLNETQRTHFHQTMFHGFDNDPAFARMSTLNLLLHGVESPDIQRHDSLTSIYNEVELYTAIITNPPFNGTVEQSSLDKDLARFIKSRTKALLFVGQVLRLLTPGGRAAVIVPDGALFGSTKAHVALRQALIDDNKLDAVIKLPSAAFLPFSSTSAAILLFTKTGSGGTDQVWFYDVRSDGFSLDKKRAPSQDNDLPDVLARWQTLRQPDSPEWERSRTAQSFAVSRDEIAARGYELSINRYAVIDYQQDDARDPQEIVAEIKALNSEIADGIAVFEEMLGS